MRNECIAYVIGLLQQYSISNKWRTSQTGAVSTECFPHRIDPRVY